MSENKEGDKHKKSVSLNINQHFEKTTNYFYILDSRIL